MNDEDYQAYLVWREAQEDCIEDEEQEQSSLPAVWEPRTPAEVFDGEQIEEGEDDEIEE